jgi:anti-sigma regulatory factor (Ser/Thr protein kinase)
MFKVDENQDQINLTLNAQTENIALLTESVESFAKRFLSEDKAFNVAVAVDEAVTNIVLHAYENDPSGEIFIHLFKDTDEFVVRIEDFSKRFIPPLMVEKKKFTFDKLEEGGLGLYLIQEFMDELRFLYDEEECKNIIIMKKYLLV